ncbi:SH3 domain-containing protein [Magnetovibrio sp. PR-2]|uniref:SH3 domain-containing protein n=1 Tax=Magnetovibrio sp. PR-2 TaxID=3120356 RepID=UPI002FCE6378
MPTSTTDACCASLRPKGFSFMRRLFAASLLSLMLSAPVGDSVAQVSGSGLPLPRFVSLRAGEVNLRTGPGVQYPVDWVYRKSGLPLEVIAEYKAWRKIRDWQGSQGWVHQTMLSSKRTFIVTGISRDLRAKPSQKSALVAQVQSNVSGNLLACPASITFCKVDVSGFEGWMNRADFWGLLKGESFE